MEEEPKIAKHEKQEQRRPNYAANLLSPCHVSDIQQGVEGANEGNQQNAQKYDLPPFVVGRRCGQKPDSRCDIGCIQFPVVGGDEFGAPPENAVRHAVSMVHSGDVR